VVSEATRHASARTCANTSGMCTASRIVGCVFARAGNADHDHSGVSIRRGVRQRVVKRKVRNRVRAGTRGRAARQHTTAPARACTLHRNWEQQTVSAVANEPFRKVRRCDVSRATAPRPRAPAPPREHCSQTLTNRAPARTLSPIHVRRRPHNEPGDQRPMYGSSDPTIGTAA
jgi:hypothetical protein